MDAYDACGVSVSGAGDVNGDGIADLLIGARNADANGQIDAGRSYVVFGRATGISPIFDLHTLHPQAGGDGSAGFIIKGVRPQGESGYAVRGAGDVNGDGIDDLLIGARGEDSNDQAYAGQSHVVFGRVTGFPPEFELRSLYPELGGDGSTGFVLKGIDYFDVAGSSVAAGDVNGDGLIDLLIGAPRADPRGMTDAGETYVVFGRTTGFPAAFELRNLHPHNGGDGSSGFILDGIDAEDYAGLAVSGGVDVNGDDIDDLLIGAHKADPDGERFAGESYIVFGRAAPDGTDAH